MAKADVRMEYNRNGYNNLRNDPAVQALCLAKAQKIALRATAMGCECEADVKAGKNRAVAKVKCTSKKALANNAKHNTLVKAVKG